MGETTFGLHLFRVGESLRKSPRGVESMKPLLLLNAGTGWAGTTPFYYTLRNAKYCHAGYKKEFHYLQMMHMNQKDFTDWMIKRYTEPRLDFRTGKLPEVTPDYDKNHYQALLEPEHSFEKYIYHMHYLKDMFPEYHAVCDFSNYKVNLPEELLTAHAKALEPHFNVKVTLLIADPVFRYYMEVGGLINQYHNGEHKREKMRMHKILNKDLLYDHYIRHKSQQKLFRLMVERSNISPNCYYESNYDKLVRSYGEENVLLLEMEDVWSSSFDFDTLSEFLEYKITPENLYPNQYISQDKNIKGLQDQNTEFEPLTEELYNWSVDKL